MLFLRVYSCMQHSNLNYMEFILVRTATECPTNIHWFLSLVSQALFTVMADFSLHIYEYSKKYVDEVSWDKRSNNVSLVFWSSEESFRMWIWMDYQFWLILRGCVLCSFRSKRKFGAISVSSSSSSSSSSMTQSSASKSKSIGFRGGFINAKSAATLSQSKRRRKVVSS